MQQHKFGRASGEKAAAEERKGANERALKADLESGKEERIPLDFRPRTKERVFAHPFTQMVSINASRFWHSLSRKHTLEHLDREYGCEVLVHGRFVYPEDPGKNGLSLEITAPSPDALSRCVKRVEEAKRRGLN